MTWSLGLLRSAQEEAGLGSLFDMIVGGGPVMVPLGVCSVVALAYAVERWIRLQPRLLGTRAFGAELVSTVRERGVEPGRALCSERSTPLARVLDAGLARSEGPTLEREKAVEDSGAREVKRLSANLQPLVVVAVIAPLLGLFGTVWGMIEAFSNIALEDGLGNPELLASGISQALITTAAGLAIAIPTQAVYYFLRGRIERFARHAEDLYVELGESLAARRAA